MTWQSAFTVLSVIAISQKSSTAYNLADKLPIFKFGPLQSKFGFSVAMHKLNDNKEKSGSNVYLLAGAPTALSQNPWLNRTGGVFYCPVTMDTSDCKRVDITMLDGEENGVRSVSDDQWLGVSLKSEGPGKNLLTCAHRFTQINLDGYGTIHETNKVRMCGRCVLMKTDESRNVVEIPGSSYLTDPCKDKRLKSTWSSKRYFGYPLAGVSIAFDKDEYYIGAPGTYSYTGAVFHIKGDSVKRTPTCTHGSTERILLPSGRWQCQKIPVTMDSYLGYSLAVSSAIDAGSNTTYYIAGAPRGNDTGAVLFFTEDPDGNLVPDVTKSLFGERTTSSFGYAIAASDLNNDGLDDLIVGVPQYLERSTARKVDGAVYIYLNVAGTKFGSLQAIKFYGSIGSFFGHAVAALGDIDQDGFNDFAVGAPSEEEAGTVHIFRGRAEKPVESQVIKGMDYQPLLNSISSQIFGFGSSLSSLTDVDGNSYPDLLVGTSSDNMVLFRSRPIISLSAKLVAKINEIDLNNKSCSVGDDHYSCFEVSFCFSFSPRASDAFPDGIRIQYTLTLDSIVQKHGDESRVRFHSPYGESTVTNVTEIQTPNTDDCWKGDPFVYVRNGISDKLSDVVIDFDFDIVHPEVGIPRVGQPIADMSNYPILDEDSDKAKKMIMPIQNTCGDDGCQSDLKFHATLPEEIVLGKNTEITLTVEISNDGEEAHQAYMEIKLPNELQFAKQEITSEETGIQCVVFQTGVAMSISCQLGNPFAAGANATLYFHFKTDALNPELDTVLVSVEGATTSQNPEILPIRLSSQVVVEVDLLVTEHGEPEQIRYKENPIRGETGMSSVADIGPSLEYTFTIENKGLTRSGEVTLIVDIPIEIYNHKWLLYLVSTEVTGPGDVVAGSCNSSSVNILELNVTSSHTRRKRELAAPQASISRGGSGLITTLTFSCSDHYAQCISLECQLDTIDPGSSSFVKLGFRIWEATLLEEYKNHDLIFIKTTASLTARTSRIRFLRDTTTCMLTTTVDHDEFTSETANSFPWWYILIAIIILVLLYVLIVIVLMRCGFFKRKKFNENEEHKPIIEEEKKSDKE